MISCHSTPIQRQLPAKLITSYAQNYMAIQLHIAIQYTYVTQSFSHIDMNNILCNPQGRVYSAATCRGLWNVQYLTLQLAVCTVLPPVRASGKYSLYLTLHLAVCTVLRPVGASGMYSI